MFSSYKTLISYVPAFILHLLPLKFEPPTSFTTVQTLDGEVLGQTFTTLFMKKPYFAFRGIPYAEPPIDHLRFKAPEPVKPWSIVKDCLNFGAVCIQNNPINSSEIIGNEDCLFLNIYVPTDKINPTDMKSVMFYIHQGGWALGSGEDDLQGPDFLMDEDVILVTINYRLGIFGFMAFDMDDYSGNMGLKDQQLALMWVHKNIKYFGGDNTKITVFGQSAGSASTHFHTLVPGSNRLFKNAIEMSYTFYEWTMLKTGSDLKDMYSFANAEGQNITNFNDLMVFLHAVDAKALIKLFPIIHYKNGAVPVEILSNLLPVVEPKSAYKPFLTESLDVILADSNFTNTVNILSGYCTNEALYYASQILKQPNLLNNLSDKFQIQLPSSSFTKNYNSTSYIEDAEKIRKFYFGRSQHLNTEKSAISFIRLLSDVFQAYPTKKKADALFRHSPNASMYFYVFDLRTELNYYNHINNVSSLTSGAGHGGDVCYIFRCNYISSEYDGITENSLQYKLIKKMSHMYANFAKYGNPMVDQYVPIEKDKFNYLLIENDGFKMEVNPNKEAVDFWDNLLTENSDLFAN